jgi:CheY-like chemotaxis protein
VDDDRDIAEIVQALLVDEGYAVSCLYTLEDDALLRMVGRLEPDCVLLDSSSAAEYGDSWMVAQHLAQRSRAIPVVMFTAHVPDAIEARKGETARAKAAAFAAIIEKPFDLDELLTHVAAATGRSVPFDRTSVGEQERTKSLVDALARHGATDIRPSELREWAEFRDKSGRLCQVYWWEGRGVYQLGRYQESGRMTMLGQFIDRDAAIEAALPGSLTNSPT